MALIKEKSIKGYTADYWKIITITADIMNWNLSCDLCLFRNKDVREKGMQNQLETQSFRWNIKDNITQLSNMTMLELIKFAYEKIVESDIRVQNVYNADGEPELDENDNPITKDIELNWFADAISDIETQDV